jgi:prophage DNA circulation protein
MAASLPYSSSLQATKMVEQLTESFEVLSDPTLHPQTYAAMSELLSTTVVFLLDQASRLPDIEIVNLPAVMPGLVLAWEYYEDPERGNEIARRNGIECAGFIPARVDLEVLSE